MSILLPDLNFFGQKKVTLKALRWFMHLDAVEETNKGVACGDSPLSVYFVYQVG